MTPMKNLTLLLILATACAGEGDDDDDEGGGRTVASDLCASGLRWAGGNQESPQMHPGRECIGCHTSGGEGPHFTLAGTVYANLEEPDDCLGVPGVVVTITDAVDHTVTLTSNQAGNFYTSQTLTMPIRAQLAFDGREAMMQASQSTGACASCHTATGSAAAPGRIVAP